MKVWVYCTRFHHLEFETSTSGSHTNLQTNLIMSFNDHFWSMFFHRTPGLFMRPWNYMNNFHLRSLFAVPVECPQCPQCPLFEINEDWTISEVGNNLIQTITSVAGNIPIVLQEHLLQSLLTPSSMISQLCKLVIGMDLGSFLLIPLEHSLPNSKSFNHLLENHRGYRALEVSFI